MQENTLIALNDVSFSYGQTQVLKGLTFSVKRGDYLGIIGPNGGGKTTLLKLILGLLEPTEGTVEMFGKDIHRFTEAYRIGYVPQRAQEVEKSFPATVEEVVRSGRIARRGLGKRLGKADTDAIDHAMELAQVSRYRDTRIGLLSGGERQRVSIARALAGEPDVLILDEPTTGIDIASERAFYELLGKLNREHRLTIIFVSHDIDVVYHEAQSVLCLNHDMICHGLSSEILKEDVIRRLYGDRATIIPHNDRNHA